MKAYPVKRCYAEVKCGTQKAGSISSVIEDGDLRILVLNWQELPSGTEVPEKWIVYPFSSFSKTTKAGCEIRLLEIIDFDAVKFTHQDSFADIINLDPGSYRPWRE